ncbi:unnamed protein product [Orchesella dallaii]|uniref:Ankyrin repeat domain-containing protein n=1 Tax=Orchesella dallaii TaxID=48710 RepID=A0ABP1Q9E3_9HEXA
MENDEEQEFFSGSEDEGDEIIKDPNSKSVASAIQDVNNEDEVDNSKAFPLHKAVFEDNRNVLETLLDQGCDIAQKDIHGNTALHIALMLGHNECANQLLNRNAPVKARNLNGWSSLAEGVSYGNRNMITALLSKSREQLKQQMSARRPHLIKALERIQDFYMELKWDFQSWVPLVSRILPSDICKIHKKGSSIRLDTTLVDFNDMKWERGDISFLFRGNLTSRKIRNNNNSNSLVVMDNAAKAYQLMSHRTTMPDSDEEVNLLMSTDIIVAQLVTKDVEFNRSQSGWIFREDKRETVGQFHADVYGVQGIHLETKKRREHLTEEDLAKNKEPVLETLTKPNPELRYCEELEDLVIRPSLPKPPKPKVTWEEYIRAVPGSPPHLGRPLNCKVSSKAFKATLAMSEDFPMTVEMLLNILEVVTPFKHLKKLREFVTMKLPPGFPVKIEIPILPTITAKITFQEFAFRDDLKEELFEIPPDYEECLNRFAGL